MIELHKILEAIGLFACMIFFLAIIDVIDLSITAPKSKDSEHSHDQRR